MWAQEVKLKVLWVLQKLAVEPTGAETERKPVTVRATPTVRHIPYNMIVFLQTKNKNKSTIKSDGQRDIMSTKKMKKTIILLCLLGFGMAAFAQSNKYNNSSCNSPTSSWSPQNKQTFGNDNDSKKDNTSYDNSPLIDCANYRDCDKDRKENWHRPKDRDKNDPCSKEPRIPTNDRPVKQYPGNSCPTSQKPTSKGWLEDRNGFF